MTSTCILLGFLLLNRPEYETNPLKIIIKTGLETYQKIVSTSQGDVCNFTPSCSRFAKKAVQKYGPIWGSLMAADRLMRCNHWAFEHFNTYYAGIKNNKIYDPVENNYIFGKSRKRRRPEKE
ncbi:MAG TPA: membrane protein insertion efficiency factor YidD [candidate division WOR-3 bacterium]|uniref:Membrane protein insertion efficiency factor YidD n=1 Tax=candidate division WOR-3 bacterium TaxID=2052148 RepID=A0A9C9ENG3_UNCW3|nr:membrane protein insertion efficiency factor YidD [candidate division WOR-3 bacterium]